MKNKKGFTLIELIVVIAILGILVLLATPKFIGYVEDAKLAQIKNDVKAYESEMTALLIKDPTAGDMWIMTEADYMDEKFYDKRGLIEEDLSGQRFYVINDDVNVNSKLKGEFLRTEDDTVYYYNESLVFNE